MGSRRKARIYAMQALFSWDMSRTPIEELLAFDWIERKNEGSTAQEETLAFAGLLVAGTIENIEQVDDSIQRHLEHWKLERLAKVDLAILRLSTYSLLHQRSIPASVTIDEAIDLAREYGSDESYRFVNGVLDAVRKEQGQ
ncbi:MAG: transcription antitermination factor NusB [Spirochaetota bacterium]